jgi:hypothetical protein
MYLVPQSQPRALGTYGRLAVVRPQRRFKRMGALTPDQAAATAMPQSTISSKAGFTQGEFNAISAAAAAGQFTNFNPAGCSGQSQKSVGPAIVSTAGGFALKFAGATGPAAPFVAAAGAALEVAGAVWGAIFGAHAAAVAKEQQVECAAVPAANDSLLAINQAVQNGTLTPAEGIQALQTLQSQFNSTIASIVKNSASQCNAGCVWMKTMQAIVAELSSQYQDMENAAAAAPASPVSAVSSAVAAAGLPSWLLPAAAFGLLWYLL